MAVPQRNRIGEILVKAKVIDDLQLRSALAHLDQWGGRVTLAVLDLNFAEEDPSTDAIAAALNIKRAQLGNIQKDREAMQRVEVAFAEKHAVFPIALKDGGKTLHVAMADPTNVTVMDELSRKAKARVIPYIAGEIEISHAIMRHYKNVEPPPKDTRRGGRRAAEVAGTDDGGDDFKITDMTGKTVMKRLSDIVDPNLAKAADGPAKPAPPIGGDGGGAGDLLDDLLGGSAPSPKAAAKLTDADMQRVVSVRANQEKSAVILKALLDLLAEKGFKRK